MIKVSNESIECMEKSYPGIKEQIYWFDNQKLPPCPLCKSEDTADVQVGIIGRTIYICCATTKFKLMANEKPGKFYCNSCYKFFNLERKKMKDIGWLFCPFGEPKINDLNAKYAVTRCDLHLDHDHWHRVFLKDDGTTFIIWYTSVEDDKGKPKKVEEIKCLS